MEKKTFQKGMMLVSEAFPKFEFSTKLYWLSLQDLKDEYFERAVLEVIKTQTELFPTSNLIAILREKYEEVKTKMLREEQIKIDQQNLKQLPEGDTRTDDWHALVKQTANKMGSNE